MLPFGGFGGEVIRALAFHLLGPEFDSHCFSMWLEPSPNVKRVSQRSAESRGFSPGTPVSSHREVDWVGYDGVIT